MLLKLKNALYIRIGYSVHIYLQIITAVRANATSGILMKAAGPFSKPS